MDYVVNRELAKARGLSEETVILIQQRQFERQCIEGRMAELDPEKDTEKLLELYQDWKNNEFYLQDLWGFKRDAAYHKDWEIPHCKCPKLDNEDMHPTTQRWITAGCIYHNR